jgi:hypothetical protein
VQRLDDANAKPPDVCGGHMGAFRNLKRVKSDKVDGGEFAAL